MEQSKKGSKKQEYLELVTAQMRCKKARDMVAEELAVHIEDQTETYLEFGLSAEDAVARAVEQMGDPVEVGTALDRIHRPRIDVRTIAFIALLSVIGMIVQILMLQTTLNVVGADHVLGTVSDVSGIIRDGLLGFLIMLAVMFVDYSFLGKHPVVPWIGLIVVMFVVEFNDMIWIGRNLGTTNLSVISALMILIFASIVYSYRNKGYKGIILCLFWLALGLLAGGSALGWVAHRAWRKHTKQAAAAEASEEERREMIAQQRAFEDMLNYNPERAYGMATGLDDLAGGNGE